MTIEIPVKTKYDPTGMRELERDAARIAREQDKAIREQVRTQNFQDRLRRNEARRQAQEARANKPGLAQQIGGQFVAANVLQDVTRGIKDFTIGSVQASIEADKLSDATDTLGARFGSTGKEITQSIQEASGYTIDQMTAMQSANQAMLLGVAKSPEEFERLTKISKALGRAMGQDAAKSLEDLTIGIGRQSKLILDNLGIMVNTEQAYSKYAATLGKSAKNLTDAEKQQAFLNEALDQGERKIAGMGDQSETTGEKVERITARWADFQIEFGRAIQDMGQGTGILDTINGALDRMIAGSQAWQSIGQNAHVLSEGLDELNDGTWLGNLEQIPIIGNQIKGLDFWGSMLFRNEELQEAVNGAGQEMRDQEQAARAAAGAMGEASAAAEDLADHLEKVRAAQENTARRLIEIEDNAAEQAGDTWDDYFDKEKDNWKDYGKAVNKIQTDNAKAATKIQKDLTKSLAKEDAEAQKDIAKIRADTGKNVVKATQEAAKEQSRVDRQRQIDAKADERLFQFDMRQLAAEGEFNQILAAKERRAIEQEIEAERQAEEDRNRQEDAASEIAAEQETAAEQIAERQRQAEERKAELQTQAAEELAANEEKLAEQLAQEQENYAERQADLRAWREERLAQIEQDKQDSIAKLAEQLTESKDLTEEEMKAMIAIAEALGPEVGAKFAEGLNDGLSTNLRIEDIINSAMGGSSSSSRGVNPATGGSFNPSTRSGRGTNPATGGTFGFQHGGEFTVGGSGGPDSQLVQFMATPGERVTITPPGGGITINASGVGVDALSAILERKVNDGMAEYHEMLVGWSRQE